jgi:hypothetical protein
VCAPAVARLLAERHALASLERPLLRWIDPRQYVLFLDQIVFPDVSFALVRRVGSLVGLALLIYGLVWDTK